MIQLPPNSSGTVLETHIPTTGTSTLQGTYNPGEVQHVALVGADGKATYSAAYTAQNAGTAATTCLAFVSGSATKVVKVLQVIVSATIATAGQGFDLQLVKESTLPTGGAKATAATIAPWDSGFPAATATTAFFTTTPTDGTSVGVVAISKYFAFIAPATTVLPPPQTFIWAPPNGGAPVILRGATQCLAVEIAAGTPGNANSFDVSFVWTEE